MVKKTENEKDDSKEQDEDQLQEGSVESEKQKSADSGNEKKVRKTPVKRRGRLSSFKHWYVVDSILFFIIVLAVTLMMILTGFAEESREVGSFESTDKYAEQLTMAFLAGTVPELNYTDSRGQETIYVDYSVKQLLIEDLRIRLGGGPHHMPVNTNSLKIGIESTVGSIMDELVGSSRTFSLNVTGIQSGEQENSVFFTIYGTNFAEIADSSSPSAVSRISINVYDPDDVEPGKLEMIIELRIY
ncbi:MAG: hypothetical protein JSV49_08470 [Thermoplasmata archaeon]|nr:MAG: hypothetical protein JSV49_08470 [Thermoplasmata archaeon]